MFPDVLHKIPSGASFRQMISQKTTDDTQPIDKKWGQKVHYRSGTVLSKTSPKISRLIFVVKHNCAWSDSFLISRLGCTLILSFLDHKKIEKTFLN